MTDESLTKLEKQLTDMNRSITDLAWVMVLLTGIIILSLQDAPMLSTESIFPAFLVLLGTSREWVAQLLLLILSSLLGFAGMVGYAHFIQ